MRPEGIEKSHSSLDRLVEHPGTDDDRINFTVIGRLIGFREASIPLVAYSGQPGVAALTARSAVDLGPEHIGRDVVLSFETGDPRCPIIMGCLRAEGGWPLANRPAQVEVNADGQRIAINSAHEIVLRCGEASITLTREGRVDIRGTYIITHAKGVNRIRGGSVQIN